MNTAKVWNRESSNYGENNFVKANGTGFMYLGDEDEAIRLITEAVANPDIQKLELSMTDGRIIWVRNAEDDGSYCECGECSRCRSILDDFKKDTENDEVPHMFYDAGDDDFGDDDHGNYNDRYDDSEE